MNEMNAIGTIFRGRVEMYLYPDGTMIPIIAGGHLGSPEGMSGSVHFNWHQDNGSTEEQEIPETVQLEGQSLTSLLGQTLVDPFTGISGTLIFRPNVGGSGRSYYYLQTADQGAIRVESGMTLMDLLRNSYTLSQTPTTVNSLQPRFNITKTKLTETDIKRFFGDGGPGGPGGPGSSSGEDPSIGRAFAAAEAEKERAWREEQARLEREAREREVRLNALLDNTRYLNEIQPDLARFSAGLSSVPLRGTTPTIGYGNALQENVNTLQGQLAASPGTAVPTTPVPTAPGMREGGMMQMGMGGVVPKFGSDKTAVLVGEERSGIDGSAEVAIMDKQTGQLQEIIPLMGGAAEGATFDWGDFGMNTADWDTSSLYGALSPLYQPFGITGSGGVPTKATAGATNLGYITPKFGTDFAPVQPPAYGPLSQQYFEKNTGMLLPNPSSILKELRILKAQNPTAYVTALSFYANATTQDGKPSGLPPQAIDSMIENAALKGRTGDMLIGIR